MQLALKSSLASFFSRGVLTSSLIKAMPVVAERAPAAGFTEKLSDHLSDAIWNGTPLREIIWISAHLCCTHVGNANDRKYR